MTFYYNFIIILLINFIKEIYEKLNKKITLIIDEPETNLDNVLLKRLVVEFKKLFKKTKTNLFFATYSSQFINDIFNIKNIDFKIPDKNKGNGFFKNENIEKINNELWTTKQQIIHSYFYTKIIICEGNKDIEFLETTIDEILIEKNILTDYMILPTFGKINIIKVLDVFKERQKNIFVLYDQDKFLFNIKNEKCSNTRCSRNIDHKKLMKKFKIKF